MLTATSAEWDEFVGRDPRSTFCHRFAWRELMEDVLGHETHYFERRSSDDGTLTGVLPLVRVRSRLFGDYLMSVPFMNYGGPLGSAETRAGLCASAIDLASSLGVDLLEIRSRDEAPPGLDPSQRKLTVIVPLASTVDEMWESRFKSKLRNKIKRPMNQGMQVLFGRQQLDPFYEIFAHNMRDLGTPVLPKRWFEAIADAMQDSVVIATVYHDSVPVCSGWGFLWNGEFELSWSSGLRQYNSMHPNMLLCWSIMQEVIGRGATAFNFGRSTPGSTQHHFKQQWGGADVPLPWGTWGRRSAPPNPNSPRYRMARSVWSRLPLPLSKRLGPTLSPYIP